MSTFEFPYYGPLTWLPAHTLYLVRHGSHAFGTATPTSDVDYKGFAIPPRPLLFGYREQFAQAEGKGPQPDLSVYDLRKFFALAAAGNPGIIETLFVDRADVLVCHELAENILAKRSMFLSRKIRHTFSNYALSQLRRIQRHYRWLKSPPTTPPARDGFDLPETTTLPKVQLRAAMAAVRKKLDSWEWKHLENVDPATRLALRTQLAETLAQIHVFSDDSARHRTAARAIGLDEDFINLLERERKYHAALTEWNQYLTWKQTRNRDRAELEARFGYDTKHAMHLVRLMRMCRETLTTGKVLVRRPDAEELLAIRAGAWEYDALVDWAEMQEREIALLYHTSPLPESPDVAQLDALCVETTTQWLHSCVD